MAGLPRFADHGGALCRELVARGRADADWWFPEHGDRGRRAKEVCVRCPLLMPCRTWGRTEREWGVWGGETEADRRRLGITPAALCLEDYL